MSQNPMSYEAARAYLLEQAEALAVEAEVIATDSRKLTLEVFESVLASTTSAQQGGLGLRVIVNGKTGYAFTEERSPAALDWALNEAKENAELQRSGNAFLPAGETLGHKDLLDEGLSAPLDAKKDVALSLDTELNKDLQTKKTILTRYTETETQFQLSSTAGARGGYRQGYAAAYGIVVMQQGDSLKQGYEIDIAPEFHSLEPGKTALKTLDNTRRLLGATALKSGRRSAYFEPRAFVSLLGLLQYMLSGKTLVEGKSLLADQLEQPVAAPCFSLIDDATLEGGIASRPFDSEGTPSHELTLIQNGILRSFLHNAATAASSGHSNTGHASRSYKGSLDVASTNLYVPVGSGVTLTDGIVITEMKGLHAGANPITGDISLQALGLEYKSSEVARPVEDFVVSGNLLDWLKRIVALGDTLEWHQAKAAPTVEIADVSFAGS